VDQEGIFHLLTIGFFLSVCTIKTYYKRRAAGPCEPMHTARDGKAMLVLRFLALPVFLLLIVYLFYPPVLGWSALGLPAWARWAGAGLAVFTTGWIWWAHQALDRNFSCTLRIREGHTLVTTGPYRWVRHPIYTSVFPGMATFCLLTDTWFLGAYAIVAFGLVLLVRVPREEAMMLEAFGERYCEYQERTGMLFPRLSFGRRACLAGDTGQSQQLTEVR
jgi:protein-S-isoprenylcysteine O-methyltransferase Ste14